LEITSGLRESVSKIDAGRQEKNLKKKVIGYGPGAGVYILENTSPPRGDIS
jgi:hypothetical protein